MKQDRRDNILFWIDVLAWALLVVLLGLLVDATTNEAHAGGDKITQHQEQSATLNQATSQRVNVSNTSDALATNDNVQSVTNEGDRFDSLGIGLAHSLGGAAIDDCLATTAGANILFSRQGTKLNKWCAAERYDRMGLPDMAARMRCQIPAIRDEFMVAEKFAKSACIEANSVPRETPNETNSQLQSTISELQSIIREQQAAQSASDERLANLEQEAEKQRKRAQRPQAKPQTIIQQEQFINDKKREALLAIRGDE